MAAYNREYLHLEPSSRGKLMMRRMLGGTSVGFGDEQGNKVTGRQCSMYAVRWVRSIAPEEKVMM